MKKLLLSSAALLALTATSFAADLPRRVMAPAPVAAPMMTAVPFFTWTGFYAGLHGGYAWGQVDTHAPALAPGSDAYSESTDVDGGVFGAQAGYNVQFGSIVAGLEGDLSWANIEGTGPAIDPAGAAAGHTAFDIDWMGSLRGRIGVAFDRVLVYGTGGWAIAGAEGRIEGGGDNRRASDNFSGWVIGAGVETAVTNNLTAKFEYTYTDFGRANFNFGDFSGAGDLQARSELDVHQVKAGLNFKFN